MSDELEGAMQHDVELPAPAHIVLGWSYCDAHDYDGVRRREYAGSSEEVVEYHCRNDGCRGRKWSVEPTPQQTLTDFGASHD